MDDSKYNRTDAHMIQRQWQNAQGLRRQVQVRWSPSTERKEWTWAITSNQKVIATDSHQQGEKLVFANGVSLGILTTLQCRPWCSEVVGQHKTDLMVFL